MGLESQRFLDLLDHVDDESDAVELPAFYEGGRVRQESCHGPMHWNTRCSAELQEVVDTVCIDEVCNLGFSVTIADPSQPDCPLVACSIGFTELTGYSVREIVGRNCRFLLNGVPWNLLDNETMMRCRAFCIATFEGGKEDADVSKHLPNEIAKPWATLPKGEMICVQTNARKTGELFKNMFYLKQVELDDSCYILGLQAGVPEDLYAKMSLGDLEKWCQGAYNRLEENMTAIEQLLAQRFWYSSSMRRQH